MNLYFKINDLVHQITNKKKNENTYWIFKFL